MSLTNRASLPLLDADDVEDLEEAPENEVEEAKEKILDQATAASTISELKLEIQTLARLEGLAAEVRRSGCRMPCPRMGSVYTNQPLLVSVGCANAETSLG